MPCRKSLLAAAILALGAAFAAVAGSDALVTENVHATPAMVAAHPDLFR